jgi:hypothetical protein
MAERMTDGRFARCGHPPARPPTIFVAILVIGWRWR